MLNVDMLSFVTPSVMTQSFVMLSFYGKCQYAEFRDGE
jgi:hypothetical protein